MNVSRLARHLLRRQVRKQMTRGINSGIDSAYGKSKGGMNPADRKRAQKTKKNVHRARRALSLFRRFG